MGILRTPRYGLKIRRMVEAVLKRKKALYTCPKCGKKKMKRVGFAVYQCKSCGYKMAGGAYEPQTLMGKMFLKILGGEHAKVQNVEEERTA